VDVQILVRRTYPVGQHRVHGFTVDRAGTRGQI
jgi:hypothetical protein